MNMFYISIFAELMKKFSNERKCSFLCSLILLISKVEKVPFKCLLK